MNGEIYYAIEDFAQQIQDTIVWGMGKTITREEEEQHYYEIYHTYNMAVCLYFDPVSGRRDCFEYEEEEYTEEGEAFLFLEIIEYVALQFWKAERGMTERWHDAMEWLHSIMRKWEWDWEMLLGAIRARYPIAMGPILRAVNGRVVARCKVIKRELMEIVWRPERVERLLLAGYDVEEM